MLMLNIPQDIHSLSDFKRDTKNHIDRLKETGRPEVLTVNGKAELVVQDAESYQKLLDELDFADSVAKIGKALERLRNGETGIPVDEAFAQLRKELNISE